jgi:hypothetical protein
MALRLSRTKNLHFAKATFPGFSATEKQKQLTPLFVDWESVEQLLTSGTNFEGLNELLKIDFIHLSAVQLRDSFIRQVNLLIGAPKALAVALSFCRLLGLGCPKQAFAKIATPR